MRLPETKVLRDPIHGYVQIQEEVIWKLIDTPEFQRLRRIRQLGGDLEVYHTAEHSRFAHSLGVYEICRRVVNEVPGVKETLSLLEQKAVLCAALLHDLGHGPFSHCYEDISKISHEDITQWLILNRDGQVFQVLAKEDPALPKLVTDILAHRSGCPLAEDLISSQLDCDRMDYLLRDAYCTGTSYGSFDLERVLRTLRVKDGILCVKRSGMHSVEDYIMARYQMYWQVYLHPDAAGYELLVNAFFECYARLRQKKQNRIALLEPIYDCIFDPRRFYLLDDFSVLSGINQAQFANDPVLADLAERIINRRLLEWKNESDLPNGPAAIQMLLDQMEQADFDPELYFHRQTLRLDEYLPYREENSIPIRILDQEGGQEALKNLSACSTVVKALLEMKETEITRLYFPKELKWPEQR